MDLKSDSFFEIEKLDKKISEKELKTFFKERNLSILNVEFTDNENFTKVYFDPGNFALAIVEDLEDSVIPGYDNIKLKINIFSGKKAEDILEENKRLYQATEKVLNYREKYFSHIKTEFIRTVGDNFITYINQQNIEKQRAVITYFIKKLGSNLLTGQSVMNISLPINIFDERSLLEVFAFQNSLSPYFLEKAGLETNALERIKLTTTYAVSMLHLSTTQSKPFNPIWGETFQAKLGTAKLYMEQTSHHPPRYHFQLLGNYFKSYGYQQPEASTSTNSVTAKSLGYHYVEYNDGGKYRIYGPGICLGGITYGKRTFSYLNTMYIVDEKADFISIVNFNPDERGFFKKLIGGKKSNLPDYFKGVITKKSHCTFDAKEVSFTPKEKHFVFAQIEGEWTDFVKFDENIYWDYTTFGHYNLERNDEFLLPSDTRRREDIIVFKSGNEVEAQKCKTKLEEIQRKDRKLRAQHGSTTHH